jgi:CRISPR-associated endoribonuclease Cas6
MRIKLLFLKAQGKKSDSIPLHHQRILSSLIKDLTKDFPEKTDSCCFSSLKGTARVMKGQINFLSSKISFSITAPEKEFVEALAKKIFSKGEFTIGNFSLVPKSYHIIKEPEFNTVMRYICISPIVACPVFTGESPILDPTSHEFSDCIYEALLGSMEKAGYTQEQLHDFAEFEITPDAMYMEKIEHSPKRYARIYKNDDDENMYGYLFPFSIHAHPEVQRFIWERGLGLYTTQGYGMLDTVPEATAGSDHIVP